MSAVSGWHGLEDLLAKINPLRFGLLRYVGRVLLSVELKKGSQMLCQHIQRIVTGIGDIFLHQFDRFLELRPADRAKAARGVHQLQKLPERKFVGVGNIGQDEDGQSSNLFFVNLDVGGFCLVAHLNSPFFHLDETCLASTVA